MLSITIIAVVVVVVLTAIIFGLAWLGYSSCLKAYKVEVEQGKHDPDIYKEFFSHPKRRQVIVKVLSYTMTCLLLLILIGLLVFGFVFKFGGINLSVGGYTPLAIKSGSMSDFCSEELAREYAELGYNKDLQFSVGDICIFEKANTEDLVVGNVYGYKYRGSVITHRLIGYHEVKDSAGNIVNTYYIFRGDNNPVKDQILVSKDKIIYHYTGKKIPVLGSFILYAQSYFGIWSLISICGIVISSDVILHKLHKLNKERADVLGGNNDEK